MTAKYLLIHNGSNWQTVETVCEGLERKLGQNKIVNVLFDVIVQTYFEYMSRKGPISC